MAGNEAAPSSLFGSLYAYAEGCVTYATSGISSFLGWEDLEVIDPDAESAQKGDKTKEEGLNINERKDAWGSKQFQQYIGMDVTSLLSVPVWIMEPFSILQKAAEIMEYTELLDKANSCKDPYERHAWVVAYTVTPFGASERAWKPFNPILGETFELEVGNGVKYLAEQVSHHPPICAAYAESPSFKYSLVSAPTSKFLGNSLEVNTLGRTRVFLKGHGDETYTIVPPPAMVHNIVIGRTWIDISGPHTVNCPTTGGKCILDFTPCGWFGYGRHEFVGFITDEDGKKRIRMSGKWNDHCDMVPCNGDGEPMPDAKPTRMWTCAEKPAGDYYSFTHFAHKLNGCTDMKEPLLSDSRRRPDRSALYAGDSMLAGVEKHRIEEMQRAEKREREREGKPWAPRFFNNVVSPSLFEGELDASQVPFWEWNGDYSKVPAKGAAKEGEVDGKNFCPWQFPDIHELP